MTRLIRLGGKPTPVVDCDVHESLTSIDDLMPYLDKPWQRYISECHFRGLPGPQYVGTAHGGRRADSWPANGGPPGSDRELLRDQHMVEHSIDYAILTGSFYRVSWLPQADFAVALASAYNDWLVDTWLEQDDRMRGSLQIPLQDVRAAVREIDRLGGHPQIVQVILPPTAGHAYGDPSYDPIYEAIVRNRLLVAIHPTDGPSATGSWPRTYMELHSTFSLAYQAQVASMVCEGTFVKFPSLRVVLLESGFFWLVSLGWTLDANWESLQLEVPWLTQRPTKYLRDHLFFGTQPVMVPENVAQFLQVVDMVDAESILLYASDYPHWDFDAPARCLPRQVPEEARRRILGRNALELYGLPDPCPEPGQERMGSIEGTSR